MMKGPFFICVVCNRGKLDFVLGHKSFNIKINQEIFVKFDKNLFTNVKSHDKHKYICITCDLNLLKGLLPCQAVCNKLGFSDLPKKFNI